MHAWTILIGGLLIGCQIAPPPATPATAPAPAPASAATDAVRPARTTPPGVKPHYVKCDPKRPELPCTPDGPALLADVAPMAPPRSDAEKFGCTVDADCAISCRVDGECCPNRCECRQAYNRTYLAALEAHQAKCPPTGCAEAACPPSAGPWHAVCATGMCVARQAAP